MSREEGWECRRKVVDECDSTSTYLCFMHKAVSSACSTCTKFSGSVRGINDLANEGGKGITKHTSQATRALVFLQLAHVKFLKLCEIKLRPLESNCGPEKAAFQRRMPPQSHNFMLPSLSTIRFKSVCREPDLWPNPLLLCKTGSHLLALPSQVQRK